MGADDGLAGRPEGQAEGEDEVVVMAGVRGGLEVHHLLGQSAVFGDGLGDLELLLFEGDVASPGNGGLRHSREVTRVCSRRMTHSTGGRVGSVPHGAVGEMSSNLKATTASRILARLAAWMMMPNPFLPRGMACLQCGQLYPSRSG